MNKENFEYEQNQNPESSADKEYYGAEASEESGAEFSSQDTYYSEASTQNEPNAETTAEVVTPAQPKTMVFSILSLIFGICSLVLCCCGGWIALMFGVAAIVFSLISRRHLGYFGGMSVTGLVLGISGAVFGLVTIILSVLVELSLYSLFPEEFFYGMEDAMDNDFPHNAF